MCAPVIGLLGTAVSAIGAIQQANAAASVAKYNAKVQEINARVARQEGLYEADRLEDRYESQRSTARAVAAKSGVNPYAGSASLIIDQESFGDQRADELATIWNSETKAVAYENQAKAYRMEAKAEKRAGIINAASTVLGSLGKFKIA